MNAAPLADPAADPRPEPPADRAALARVGAQVRARLAADPTAYRLPGDRAEIFAFGNFLSSDECDRLMAMVDAVAVPSRTFDVVYHEAYRTSYSGDFSRDDPFVAMIERRIDDLLGFDPSFGEAVQGQRYAPGQQFKPHHDWFHTTGAYWPGERRSGGQRAWTAMAYLNDVEAGGETEFPALGLSIAPQRGALLVWNNALPDGAPNPDTVHAGTPVVAGMKYIVTKWYRTRAWRARQGS